MRQHGPTGFVQPGSNPGGVPTISTTMEEETKIVDFNVHTPNGKVVMVQIPVRYTPGVTPEGEEVLTPEAHDIIEQARTHNKIMHHGWPY